MRVMHRGPVIGISSYDKRRATPVLLGSKYRRECGESGNSVSGRGQRARDGRWAGDEDGATRRAPWDTGLEASD